MKLPPRLITNTILIVVFGLICVTTLPRAFDQLAHSSQDLPKDLGAQAAVVVYKDILTISLIGLCILSLTSWSWLKVSLATRIIGILTGSVLFLSIYRVSLVDSEISYFYNSSYYTALYVCVAIASVPFVSGFGYPKIVHSIYRKLKKTPL